MTVAPSQVCGACGRRMPHPKTDKSPASRTFSVKLPADDHDSLKTMVDDLANGPFRKLKYPRAAAIEAGLMHLTQRLTPAELVQVAREMRGAE